MGRPGQRSVQYGFKVPVTLAEKIEEERALDGTTLAGFFNDAIKHYIAYREKRRLDIWKMEKEVSGATKNTGKQPVEPKDLSDED